MKHKLTKQELRWVMYDIGNSAFILLATTIVPIYFNGIAAAAGMSSTDYLAYWGYAASITTLLVAFSGPILGTISDGAGRKKPVFIFTLLLGSLGCLLLGFAQQWMMFLLVLIIAKTGYSLSLIIYDSMLSDVTSKERMDEVSAKGYAWGYLGSCAPFAVCLVLVLGAGIFGLTTTTAMGISFAIVTVWWIGFSVPHIKNYRQIHSLPAERLLPSVTLRRLGSTFKEIVKNRVVLMFLIAFFCYIDGVYTIIDMALAYGTALGLDSTGLLMALLVTQVLAFPCAIIMGRLSAKYSSVILLTVCILAYVGIAVFALFLQNIVQFWILAVLVGMFQGSIQALSRSHFAKLIPPEKSGEYFGIMDICGKGASFLGSTAVSVTTQITGNANLGVGVLAVFFVVGLILFRISAKKINPPKPETQGGN